MTLSGEGQRTASFNSFTVDPTVCNATSEALTSDAKTANRALLSKPLHTPFTVHIQSHINPTIAHTARLTTRHTETDSGTVKRNVNQVYSYKCESSIFLQMYVGV